MAVLADGRFRQRMWEGWTESTQQAVDATLKEHGVVMLTAEARDGELAVKVFEGTKSLPRRENDE